MRNIYCGNCEKEVLGITKEDYFEYPVRNLVYKINGKRLFCPDCGNELFHREYDEANQRAAFDLYRKETGIISPKEIKDIREKYELTQREFSYLLGFGEITVSRYERGSLPTIAQSQIIKESIEPSKMLILLKENGHKIETERYIQTKNRLEEMIANKNVNENIEQYILRDMKNITTPELDVYNGFKRFDYKKFSQMVYFFALKEITSLYITKLNKLMFYADYYYYKKFGTSLSGTRYIRHNYGPVPNKYQTLYDSIDTIEIFEDEYGNYIKPANDLALTFNDKEISILDLVNQKFKHMNSKEISNFSHKEKCWIETPHKQPISYLYSEFMECGL
ncbi:hypothetical protein Dred_0030 [Desulforamulus reducens MI-1]|uniref:HTH cro/C1-type domain-containing protein n=1 Tax=Desulforamulus reducens (strain ATCC BAA-1160 / DSM 100696 / MI-1) TaxID=349161 RepID=A4J0H7_DESRM|nr:type II TA system antitoxin MqsA family protein [Desulforamulus reducens]ABO48580.1 hypothetical protein Dred_0030 [Desulforamulus reducens MI-1]